VDNREVEGGQWWSGSCVMLLSGMYGSDYSQFS
jgi:hypothetical protein